jgi:hypothetical protein
MYDWHLACSPWLEMFILIWIPVSGNVFRRFEQFSNLYTDLTALSVSISRDFVMPPFPSRMPKLLIDHSDPNFIEQRRVLLDNFLHKLVPFADICESAAFMAFVVPDDDDPFVPAAPARAPPEPELEQEVIDESVFALDGKRRADEQVTGCRISEFCRVFCLYSYSFVFWFANSQYSEITSITVPCAQVLKNEHVVYQLKYAHSVFVC